ncbi:MAG: ankyrin repeat domain-containing protein [Spirochaetales bacterium]|nr:ankyrin repeat domain-containing protein [Spirochaetales bacterium]
MEYLCDRGFDVNLPAPYGTTPLHYSTINSHIGITRFLPEHGAEVNAVNKYKTSPLHHSSEKGDKESIELLIASGADAFLKNSQGNDCFNVAKDVDTQHLLIELTGHDPVSGWLLAAVQFYRELGFWPGFKELNDHDLVISLKTLNQEQGNPVFNINERETELRMLSLDKTRDFNDTRVYNKKQAIAFIRIVSYTIPLYLQLPRVQRPDRAGLQHAAAGSGKN